MRRLHVRAEHLALGGGGGGVTTFSHTPEGASSHTRHPSLSPITSMTWVPLIVVFSALWMVACGASQKASLMMTLRTSGDVHKREGGGGAELYK